MSMNPATRESKTREITVPLRDVTPETAELPVEVDDEEIDDAEPTAAEDGDGPAGTAVVRAAGRQRHRRQQDGDQSGHRCWNLRARVIG